MNKSAIVMATMTASVIALASAADARDRIRIVGSSAVFPFSTVVAEQFGQTSSFVTPMVDTKRLA